MATQKSWQNLNNDALLGNKKQHDLQNLNGKKTARNRINTILDPESFEEIDRLATSPYLEKKYYTDGVICGFGTVQGKKVALYAQDFTIKGGSLGKRAGEKICKIMDMASKIGCPIIGIIDSGGIDEGIHALAAYGDIFMRNVRYSGVIPQISLVLGPCAGGAVYSPAITDFIFTVEKISNLFITGPQVIKQVTHEDISKEELGGTHIHSTKSGLIHYVAQNEDECFDALKLLLSYLPENYRSLPQQNNNFLEPSNDIDWKNLIPENPNKAYDVKCVIKALIDENSFFEIQENFAPHIVVGFARIGGMVVGIVANQALIKAGTLDIDASCKAARFIKTCNNFNIAIVSLVDVPGFMPGVEQEHNGIIRHGAKLIYAYAQATVPKITVILRKSFGGAYIVMGSKHLGADFVYAYPSAQIAVLGAEAAVLILHRKKLAAIENENERALQKKELLKEYEEKYLTPFIAAESGYIDAIIQPEKTRNHLIRALQITSEKVEKLPSRKHGNIPL
jgi:acetyl-CoA carboxylase carboxyltransferase component